MKGRFAASAVLTLAGVAGFLALATVLFRFGEKAAFDNRSAAFFESIHEIEQLEKQTDRELDRLNRDARQQLEVKAELEHVLDDIASSLEAWSAWQVEVSHTSESRSRSSGTQLPELKIPPLGAWGIDVADELLWLVAAVEAEADEGSMQIQAARRFTELEDMNSLVAVLSPTGAEVWRQRDIVIPANHVGVMPRGPGGTATVEEFHHWWSVSLGGYRLVHRQPLRKP